MSDITIGTKPEREFSDKELEALWAHLSGCNLTIVEFCRAIIAFRPAGQLEPPETVRLKMVRLDKKGTPVGVSYSYVSKRNEEFDSPPIHP